MNNDGMLSPSDIAELAGVSRAAVSNWRTRYFDFPAPAGGTEGRPMFERSHVTAWLQSQNKPFNESAALQVWSSLNSLRDTTEIDELVFEAHRLIAICYLAHRGDNAATALWADLRNPNTVNAIDAERLNHVLESIAPTNVIARTAARRSDRPSAVGLLTLANAISAVEPSSLIDASTLLLDRAGAAAARAGSAHGLATSRAAAILVAAADHGTTIYDPACGISEAAQTLAARNLMHSTVTGVDVNADALFIAAVRAGLRGIKATFALADVLAFDPHPELRADLIVAEPPYALRWDAAGAITDPRWRYGIPPRSSADFAWIQHVLAHLAPGGRGYVLTTRTPLARPGTEGRIRAEILKNDLVRVIIGLPGKLLPNTSIPLALWVLGSPRANEEPGYVHIIDATSVESPEDEINTWLTSDKIDAPNRRVPIAEILAADAALTPARWVGAVAEAPTARAVSRAIEQLSHARAAIANLPEVSAPVHTEPPRVVRLNELVEHGTVQFSAGRIAAIEVDDDLVVRPSHIRDGFPPVPTSSANLGSERQTSPGDVLVTRLSRIYSRVDHEGGRVPARGVYVLTPNSDEINAEYLAHCIAGSWNEALQTGPGIFSVKDIEIPLLPIAAQAQIAQQLRDLHAADAAAAKVQQASAQAAEQLLKVARYGLGD
ncbi:HsdM family class I SAM-dependent methyltransferase [Microcella sp.]|uniref:HsdM family class I SAM-dependent methyltransferase n=1 Tax=Microcella sp. TaxID=1913979 RepID=UPI003F6EBEFC